MESTESTPHQGNMVIQVLDKNNNLIGEISEFETTPPEISSSMNTSSRESAFLTLPRKSSVWPALVLATLFVLVSLASWSGFSADITLNNLKADGQYWRLLTALFVHADFGHILSNTTPFLFFGWTLYSYFGWIAFPVVPLIIGVVSNALTVMNYDPRTHLLGASGMVYGMVSLWLVLYVYHDLRRTLKQKVLSAILFTSLLLLPDKLQSNVSYLAHFSGFSLGIVSGLTALPYFSLKSNKST
jgi:rhomboid protease GluP